MTVIPFNPQHLENFTPSESQQSEVPQTVMHQAFTFMDEDKPVAIFGGFFFIPGVIHFWGLVSDGAKKKPLAFHRRALEVLNFYEKHDKPRRIQIDVRADFTAGHRWAEALGFQREGLMRAYGLQGEDFYLYARVSSWAP